MFETSFCFHTEDSDLCSINYQHEGKPKIWYGVPDSEREKLHLLIKEIVSKLNVECSQYVRHKRIMIPPSVLRQRGIKFTRVSSLFHLILLACAIYLFAFHHSS